ncbi:response regulator [uncultured Methanobacterium sp.]|uniref:response regulator n=1 Tax=uncultured Methanobacterium sp. TaxID=176306 RepID=UPI002AA94E5F|nr:response regulator [uncultured Methanobacterium sp.]
MTTTKIIVVEDESIEALDIKNTLESFGYQVPYIASRGDEAVVKAQEIKPDLVLMDIILKGEITGIEAASEIKKLDIPFIYLTAHSNEKTVEKAKLTEPYGYLLKPFNANDLKHTIELALHKHMMENKLKESENRYRLLVESQKDFIVETMPKAGLPL